MIQAIEQVEQLKQQLRHLTERRPSALSLQPPPKSPVTPAQTRIQQHGEQLSRTLDLTWPPEASPTTTSTRPTVGGKMDIPADSSEGQCDRQSPHPRVTRQSDTERPEPPPPAAPLSPPVHPFDDDGASTPAQPHQCVCDDATASVGLRLEYCGDRVVVAALAVNGPAAASAQIAPGDALLEASVCGGGPRVRPSLCGSACGCMPCDGICVTMWHMSIEYLGDTSSENTSPMIPHSVTHRPTAATSPATMCGSSSWAPTHRVPSSTSSFARASQARASTSRSSAHSPPPSSTCPTRRPRGCPPRPTVFTVLTGMAARACLRRLWTYRPPTPPASFRQWHRGPCCSSLVAGWAWLTVTRRQTHTHTHEAMVAHGCLCLAVHLHNGGFKCLGPRTRRARCPISGGGQRAGCRSKVEGVGTSCVAETSVNKWVAGPDIDAALV